MTSPRTIARGMWAGGATLWEIAAELDMTRAEARALVRAVPACCRCDTAALRLALPAGEGAAR